MSITNEPISKTLFCVNAKSLNCIRECWFGSGFTTIFNVEKRIDKPAQIKYLGDMKKEQPTFLVKILDEVQKTELVCREGNTNFLNPKHNHLEYSTVC